MYLQFICGMGLTGNTVTERFLRHFNTIAISEFTDSIMTAIYTKIMQWHIDVMGFEKDFDYIISQIVEATLIIYKESRLNLLPTPAKSHYLFNLRDFSRVIQGVLLSVPASCPDILSMKKLWVHEILRVYCDRLIDDGDRGWLCKKINNVCSEILLEDLAEMFPKIGKLPGQEVNENDLRQVMYCDFTNPFADRRLYLEVEDPEALTEVVEGYLAEYNSMTKKPMNLVLFTFAIEHLSRSCRVLKQPRSHGLSVGVGGSGRQSLSRLAAHITDYELSQVNRI